MDLSFLMLKLERLRMQVQEEETEVRVVSEDDMEDCHVYDVCVEKDSDGKKFIAIKFNR